MGDTEVNVNQPGTDKPEGDDGGKGDEGGQEGGGEQGGEQGTSEE